MTNTYVANEREIRVLRKAFGNHIDSALFLVEEYGPYARVDGFDRDGKRLGDLGADDYPYFYDLAQIAQWRNETDNFNLTGIAPPPLPADEQRMADLLDKVRKAAWGDSNDDEIDAYRDALEEALDRWPGLSLDY